MLGFCPDFFRFWLDFFTFWHPESAQVVEKMQNRRQFCQKNLFILFWPIIVCGRGSTSETHKEVRFLNGSEASGKLRYRNSQRHAWEGSRWENIIHVLICAYMRTCAHGYMPRAYVHAANHGTATRDGIAATRKDLCVGRLKWENIICVLICIHAYVRLCVRTYARTYARTNVRMYACAHVLHLWVRVWFFFPAWAFPRIGLRVAIPSRVAWVAVPQFTACFRSTACFWSSLCAWVCVSLVLSRMYAHMSMRIGLSQREPSHA